MLQSNYILSMFRRLSKASVGGGLAYYLASPFFNSETEYHYKKTRFNEAIVQKVTPLKEYKPPIFLGSGIAQLLFNNYVCKDKHRVVEYTRSMVPLPDGGTLAVDYASSKKEAKAVVVVFPGLSGGSNKGYCKSLVQELLDEGFDVAVLHGRGMGGSEYTSMGFIDITGTDDIAAGMEFVRGKADGKRITGVGISLGANLMVKYAGLCHATQPMKAMVSINNPFDMWLAINLMRGKIYEKYLVKELRTSMFARTLDPTKMSANERKVFEEMKAGYGGLDFPRMATSIETWRQFDEEFTIKVHKHFSCAAAYYSEGSCLEDVSKVAIPTLVIHSKDDPIVPIDCVPIDECVANEHFVTAVTPHGSHVCYFEFPGGQSRWYTRVAASYLDSALKLLDQ